MCISLHIIITFIVIIKPLEALTPVSIQFSLFVELVGARCEITSSQYVWLRYCTICVMLFSCSCGFPLRFPLTEKDMYVMYQEASH